MKRNTLNFIVDSAGFIALLGVMVSGFIIQYVLPPGSGGRGRMQHDGMGHEHIKSLWSMGRHEWGDIHFCLALIFIVLMILHVFLHWSWVKGCFKSFFGFSQNELNKQ